MATHDNKPEFATELDYSKHRYRAPMYRYHKVQPESGTSTQLLTVNGGQNTIFKLPNSVYNLAHSYLTCTVTVPASGGGNLNWIYASALTLIRQIIFATIGNTQLATVEEVSTYTNMVWPYEIAHDDFINFQTPSRTITHRLFGPSNVLASANRRVYANSNSDVNYLEQNYALDNGGGAANTAYTFRVQIPLSAIPNTIFAVDKDLYFDQIMQLTINWNSSARIYFFGTDAANPTAGATTAPNSVTLDNISLYVAEDKNVFNQAAIKKQVMGEGLKIQIPMLKMAKNTLQPASLHTVNIRLNRSDGHALRKIYHATYGNEITFTRYDHQNLAQSKINNFYTVLDSQRLQEYNVDCSLDDDWLLMQEKCRGSCILSQNIFKANWGYIENFADSLTPFDRPRADENLVAGLDLNADRQWTMVLAIPNTVTSALNHYTYTVCDKLLTISSAGISLM